MRRDEFVICLLGENVNKTDQNIVQHHRQQEKGQQELFHHQQNIIITKSTALRHVCMNDY